MTETPPQNLEAETVVLGSMLVSEPAVRRVVDEVGLRVEDFYLDRHRLIYTAMIDLFKSGTPVDHLTIADALSTAGDLDSIGGKNALFELSATVSAPGNVKHHAEIIRRVAVDRESRTIAQELAAGRITGAQAVEQLREITRRQLSASSEVDRLRRAGEYLLDVPEQTVPIWGAGDEVLWATGEPLLIAAPQGVGKTTLAQQLTLARLGVREPRLLGLPVAPDDRPVLYIAADRPEQARRSFGRMVSETDRERLDAGLLIWRGPPPVNVVEEPSSLYRWITTTGAGTVILDSLKDLAVGLAKDEVGAAVNLAIQELIANGIEFAACHHQRKSQDGRKPRELDDVYGSTWITSGAGSVALLWGKPGDAYVELNHLKHPATEVGPMEIRHDHDRGLTTVPEPRDLIDMARHGITVKDAAAELYSTTDPDRNQIERARRKLEKLAGDGLLKRHPSSNGDPVTFEACDKSSVTPRDPSRDPLTDEVTQGHASSVSGSAISHAGGHAGSRSPQEAARPPLRGAADPGRDTDRDVSAATAGAGEEPVG